jgi:predicted RNase H-like HicB family nuclease
MKVRDVRIAAIKPSERGVMKKLHYLVRINKDAGSDWGASVPDLPGCVATGRTLDTTLRRIQGAIELHLRGLREDGVRPPRPQQRVVTPKRTARQFDFYATVEVAA